MTGFRPCSRRCDGRWWSCSRSSGTCRSATPGLDRASGVGWAGGYVGDGVSTTNLAGRTLADLITGADTSLIRLPWVGHRSRRWEPEPLRWLGVNAGLQAMRLADWEEAWTKRRSVAGVFMGRFLGG